MLDQLIITSLLEPLFLEVAVDVVAVTTLAPLQYSWMDTR